MIKLQRHETLFDKPLLILLVSNILTILLAIIFEWRLFELIWVYWAQSIIIGFYNWRRMRSLRNFSTKGLRMNNNSVPETEQGKKNITNFFMAHYGLFHLVYFIFLLSGDSLEISVLQLSGFIISIFLFIYNHHYSYRYNLELDTKGKPNIGAMMFIPYARIIPMHVIIILGAQFSGTTMMSVVLFLSLKTLADLAMHVVEHRMLRTAAGRKTVND